MPQLHKGGSWLFEDVPPHAVFSPEQLTDEHRLIARTVDRFVDTELLPAVEQLESKDWNLTRRLMKRCAELGLLGLAAPEVHGGLALDKASSLVVVERIARSPSFATTFGGVANLSVLPLVMFGTDDQQARYLPPLIAGDLIGAYALSEATSGSDALAARTRAAQQSDGSWVLSGEKLWISNGAFADLFIVFAKTEGDRLTAFLVERGFPGISTGAEEHKMGLHGSSTTPFLMQDAHVPAGNVLGEVGRGHKVALNTLNYGRFSLGAMCAGGSKAVVGYAARYAASRTQFGQPIAAFGAIKHKLGEMVARTYAAESIAYRTAGLIDEAIAAAGSEGAAIATACEEYAIEASICKVAGSEILDYVVDENVQVHGGNGFVHDYSAERLYRDARVNRIFEGTNEINRLLIPGMLVKRGRKGGLPLVAAAQALHDQILGARDITSAGEGPLATEHGAVTALKRAALVVLGTALQTYGDQLEREQEVLSLAADVLIEAYTCESVTARADVAQRSNHPHAALHVAAARVYVHDAVFRADIAARTAAAAMTDGDDRRTLLAALRKVLKPSPVNTVALRRQLAEAVTAKGGYILG